MTRGEKIFTEYEAMMRRIAAPIVRPPNGVSFYDQVDDLLNLKLYEPQITEMERTEITALCEEYVYRQERSNTPFFVRLVTKDKKMESFFPLYRDDAFPMKALLDHLKYDPKYCNPLLVAMDDEIILEGHRFHARLKAMDERKLHPEREYIVKADDWEDYQSKNSGSVTKMIYEFINAHSVEAAQCEYVLNAAWDKPCAILVEGIGNTKTICECRDVTWNFRNPAAWETADKAMDDLCLKFWLGLFDKIESGRELLYCFLRYARQERIPGIILAGKSRGGKSIITMMFASLKAAGANTTAFSSEYEDAGKTSLITCEEFSNKKHKNMDINTLKDLITASRFQARQIYEAETTVKGHRYVMITDNFDHTPLYNLLGRKTTDEESIRNRISVFGFTTECEAWNNQFPQIDDIVRWTTGTTRLNPRNYPYSARFAKYLHDHEEELFGKLKKELASRGSGARTGVPTVNSKLFGLHQMENPIAIKALKLLIDYVVLLPRHSGKHRNTEESWGEGYTKFSYIHAEGKVKDGWGNLYCKLSRRLRREFDEELKKANLITYNQEHGDRMEIIIRDTLGHQAFGRHDKVICDFYCLPSDQYSVGSTDRKAILDCHALDLRALCKWIAKSRIALTFADLPEQMAERHYLPPGHQLVKEMQEILRKGLDDSTPVISDQEVKYE